MTSEFLSADVHISHDRKYIKKKAVCCLLNADCSAEGILCLEEEAAVAAVEEAVADND